MWSCSLDYFGPVLPWRGISNRLTSLNNKVGLWWQMVPEWVFLSLFFSAKLTPWLIACFSIWEEVSGGVCVIALVSWLCVAKGKCYEILSSLWCKMLWPDELRPLCLLGQLVVLQVGRRATKDPTPVFSLIRLHKSSSLLFFLIKSDNIWRAREDSFNVASVTAGVVLAILAICFICYTFITAVSEADPNTVIQSFKPPLWKSL